MRGTGGEPTAEENADTRLAARAEDVVEGAGGRGRPRPAPLADRAPVAGEPAQGGAGGPGHDHKTRQAADIATVVVGLANAAPQLGGETDQGVGGGQN